MQVMVAVGTSMDVDEKDDGALVAPSGNCLTVLSLLVSYKPTLMAYKPYKPKKLKD